jgi:DNA-binding winged helix-turn-helix (wHTH) protein/predicted ATPase
MQYTLGDYTLDTQRYELRHAGTPLKLQPKIVDLLAYLIQHRNRVVTRQELFEALRPEQFVSDDALEWVIAAARRAVGDNGRVQRVIQTIRNRGYRFVARLDQPSQAGSGEAWRSPPASLHVTAAPPLLPPTPGAERKQVTVLAGSLLPVGTSGDAVDPETLYTVRQRFFAFAQREVQGYAGAMQHFVDNAFLAFFGAPVAQEDHAQRAVLTALRLRECLRHPDTARLSGTGQGWTVCMGVHTGEVIVGPIGDDLRPVALAVDDTTQVAEQLRRLAEAGTIVLSAVTARLVQDVIRLDRAGLVTVPGTTAPQRVYKVLGLLPYHPALKKWQGRRVARRFVGREREMGTLHALLAQVEADHGQVVGIAGEPGIGKSRFLYEFRQQVRHRAVTHLAGRCVSYRRATPYLPLLDLLRQACGLSERDTPAETAARVGRYLQDIGMESEAWVPYVLHLLGISEGIDHTASLSPQALRERIFETLMQMQLHASHQRPLLLEVEDAHWIDPTSEEWLAALIERLAGAPILVLLSYRSGYQPAWMGKAYATQLALQRLTADESRALVWAILPPQTASDRLVQAIVAKGQGNPFFLEELAQAVVEQGAQHATLVIPETIQAVLAARLDRLPPAAKSLLQVAAVIGAEVSGAVLQAVTALDDTVLRQHLAPLQAAELLYEARPLPEPVYAFKHALTQEVAYQSLLRTTRQEYHRQIAEVLAQRCASQGETQPEVLAHHYTKADLYQQAVHYWYKASQHAEERSAYMEAIVHLTKGPEVLALLPDTCDRTAQELTLQLALHVPLAAVEGHGSPAHVRALRRAQELSQVVGDTQQQIHLLGALGTVFWKRQDLQPARALAGQLLRLGLEVRDARGCRWGHQNLGFILYHLGELASAQFHLEQALTFYDPQQSSIGADLSEPRVFPLAVNALVLWTRGYPDRALEHIHQALAIAQEVAHPFSLGLVLCYAATLHHYRRDWQTTQHYVDALLTLTTAHGFPLWTAEATWLRGATLVEQGHPEAGVVHLRQWQAATQGRDQPAPFPLSLLAEAYGAVGQLQAGLAVAEEALAAIPPTGKRVFLPRLYCSKSKLLLALSIEHQAAAERCLQQALALARQQGAKMWELRAALSLSRLWQRQGKYDTAHQLLAEVYGWLTEGFDTHDLQDARVLLRQLTAVP